MQFLKQSTAVDVLIGPFVDLTDGATAETGESPTVKLSKNGQTLAAKNDATTPVHDADGYYNCELDATDTNTLGTMVLTVAASANALPVRHEFMVVVANTYDSLVSGSDTLDVTVDATSRGQLVDDIWDEATAGHVAAGSFGGNLPTIESGTAQAGAATTITLAAGESATDDFYNDQFIYILSGTGVGQGRIISDYNGTTKVATVSTWAVNPDATSVYQITPFGSVPGASAPTAAQVADAVWDEAMGDHVSEGSFGTMLQGFHEGTAQAGTSSSLTLDATGSSSTTDFYKYAVIEIVAGTGASQSRQITAYNGTTKVATVDPAWSTTPSTDSEYVIKGLGIDAATTAQIADGVWDELRSGHVTAGSFGEYVLADAQRVSGSTTAADGLEAAVSGVTPLPSNVTQVAGVAEDLPTATALATVDSNVDAILVDTGTAGVLVDAASVRTAVGLAAANLDTQLSTIDTVADNIETDTQDIQSRLPAALTVAGNMNANVEEINTVTILGDGSATPFDV